jgi:2-haloacid dehalogenase
MVIVFDVYGTLLDLRALDPCFQSIFGTSYSARQWQGEVVQYAMALSLTGTFREFGDVAGDVLKTAAAARGPQLRGGDIRDIRTGLKSLPPFPDARRALARLHAAGHRLAALSNSGPSALRKGLRNAGLDRFFEQALSVAEVKRYKPDLEVYRFAARRLGVRPRQMMMVAAHPWDLMGAARAGCRTALIRRPDVAPFAGGPKPDIIADDLDDFAARIGVPERAVEVRRTASPGPLGLLAGLAALGVAGALLFGSAKTRRPQLVVERIRTPEPATHL